MATQAELAAELQAVRDQVVKTRNEVLARIAELELAIETAGGTTPEVDEALVALKAEVQASDDVIPDPV